MTRPYLEFAGTKNDIINKNPVEEQTSARSKKSSLVSEKKSENEKSKTKIEKRGRGKYSTRKIKLDEWFVRISYRKSIWFQK